MTTRHLLSLMDLSADEIRQIIYRAIDIKKARAAGQLVADSACLRNRTAVLVFEQPSTRTRVSFEAGIAQLGGSAIFLAPQDSQLARKEPIADTARVLSRMASLIIVRTGEHARLEKMAEAASVPVINGLTDYNHPCQLLADMQTWIEHRGDIAGKTAAWVGDGNNVCHSWMNAARLLGFKLNIATPEGYQPDAKLVAACGDCVALMRAPEQASKGADLIVTDTWASMSQQADTRQRTDVFSGYCVDEALMAQAKDDAIFMHCLPAYRGMEVTASVIDGAQSVVWDEAENRLYAQQALMAFLLAVDA